MGRQEVAAVAGRGVALLEAVHAHPGLTRAEAGRLLGIGTGAATGLVAGLVRDELLAEEPAAPTGARGRPTRRLTPHPHGPLILAAMITQELWRLDVVELGGRSILSTSQAHEGRAAEVLGALAAAVRRARRRFPRRVRGLGVSVPGTIPAGGLLDAVGLGWRSLDLRTLWPGAPVFEAGNDATLAALAESRRGAGVDAALAVHLRIDNGLGGAVVDRGRTLAGARGVAGEFGHMPFGDPATTCPCGAAGCWGTAVDGGALARILGEPIPRDPVTRGRAILSRAGQGEPAALAAARTVAAALGRGIAGLVNGLDPDVVTLGGFAADLFELTPGPLHTAYRAGLMDFRRATPTPVLAAALGETGPLVGAAEQAWSGLWRQLRLPA
jgi:predicted NBD/HSP70 family sugar kinase